MANTRIPGPLQQPLTIVEDESGNTLGRSPLDDETLGRSPSDDDEERKLHRRTNIIIQPDLPEDDVMTEESATYISDPFVE